MIYNYVNIRLFGYLPCGKHCTDELMRYFHNFMLCLNTIHEFSLPDIESDYSANLAGAFVASNSYDYAGRRVSKTTESAAHTYFYDGWLLVKEVIAHTNGAAGKVYSEMC